MNTSTRPDAAGFSTLWWNHGDAFRSRLFDAISLLLPCGEQFVITATTDWLRTAQHSASMATLQRDVLRLIREEHAHSRAHRLYNERLATHAPTQQLEQRVASAMAQMAGWALSTRIAFSAAFEYLTALLSEEALRPRGPWLDQNTTQQVRLWRWHCEEEINHRHVAQDVADAMGIGQGRQALVFLAAACYLCADIAVALAALLMSDVRARRIGMGSVLMQAAGFGIRALPSMLRMAGKSVHHLVVSRRRR